MAQPSAGRVSVFTVQTFGGTVGGEGEKDGQVELRVITCQWRRVTTDKLNT